jgi:hypothetical protein
VKFNYRTVHITPMIWKYSVRHSLARIVRLRHGHRGISTLRHKSLHLKFRNQKIQSDTPLGTRHTASTSAQRSPATHARRGGGGVGRYCPQTGRRKLEFGNAGLREDTQHRPAIGAAPGTRKGEGVGRGVLSWYGRVGSFLAQASQRK